MIRTIVLAFLMVVILCFTSQAADLNKMSDKFYAGLADIIESNMDDASSCVVAVERYYQENKALVAQIREETAKVLAQSAPMMNKMMNEYMSMSEAELEAMEKKYKGMQQQGQKSPGMTRYSKALQEFTSKYPKYGVEIAIKAMQLVPVSDIQKSWQNMEIRNR